MRLKTSLKWIILVVFLVGCSRNPVTGKSEFQLVSESQEIQIGESSYQILQQAEGGPFVTMPRIQQYVEKIGKRLADVSDRPQLPYEFIVLDNSIPNAWSLPGGKIGINRGLLTELHSEAELAAVLAHEIVHSAARHSAKHYERSLLLSFGLLGLEQVLADHKYEDVAMGTAAVGATLITLKYSRSAELEADKYGIKYMAAAGYDPQAAVELQKTFLKLSKGQNRDLFGSLFATHPPSEDRIEANQSIAATYPAGGTTGVRAYETAIAELRKAQPAYDDLDRGYEALLKGNSEKALSLAQAGLKIEPREGHLYNLKGKAEVMLGHSSAALSSFNTAIELNPSYFDYYLQRGRLRSQLGDLAGGQKDLEKSCELLPSAEAYLTRGDIALKQGNLQLAIDNYRIAAKAQNRFGDTARRRLSRLMKST